LRLALEELRVHRACDEIGMAHDPTEEGWSWSRLMINESSACRMRAERLRAIVAVHDSFAKSESLVRGTCSRHRDVVSTPRRDARRCIR